MRLEEVRAEFRVMLGAAGHGQPEALLFKSCCGGLSGLADLSFLVFVFSLTAFSCGNNLRQDPGPSEVDVGTVTSLGMKSH